MYSHARTARQVVTVLAVAGLAACEQDSFSPAAGAAASPMLEVSAGNGAPSGPHFNLNIIAVSQPKSEDMSDDGGHVIFVKLGRKDAAAVTTKIMLEQSAGAGVFEVLDKNGTDGQASFSLPAPGSYTVWARALGKPGGEGTLTTCATDVTGTIEEGDICSTENEVFVRGSGKSSFRNVTEALTTISLDPVLDAAAVDACGSETVSLFDSCLEGYFWQYDNRGLKLLQLRFYPA